MATFWDTFMWVFGAGRRGAGPNMAQQHNNQQQAVLPNQPIQLGGDGDNGNYAIFLYQQIYNAASQLKDAIRNIFMVQVSVLALFLMWIIVKRVTDGLARLGKILDD